MSGDVFVDTNVLVYARDSDAGPKRERAAAWLEHLWHERRGALSVQVLQEYYVVVTSKLDPGLEPRTARDDIRDLEAWSPLPIDGDLLDAGWEIEDRYGFSWWDSLIVAAAQRLGCTTLLTEDLQHGQTLGDVEVLDPFEAKPD